MKTSYLSALIVYIAIWLVHSEILMSKAIITICLLKHPHPVHIKGQPWC